MNNNGRREIKEMLRKEMAMSDFALLQNDWMANMMDFDGNRMLIMVANEFLKKELDKPDIVKTIENVAGRYYGKDVTVKIKIGSTTPQLFPKKEEENKKPRMCEILGVEVGDKFRIKIPRGADKTYYVDVNGVIRLSDTGKTACIDTILFAINHPDRIIKNKLTEKEQKICEAIGAMYVTMDMKTHYNRVELWKNEPKCDEEGNYKHTTNGIFNEPILACVLHEVFGSVKPGDCIYVGE